MSRFLLTLILLVSIAKADDFLPCDPVFIAGPQGRPISNAVVSITETNGAPIPGGVWLNSTGTMPFNDTLPADQILQVFAEAGIYRVVMSGEGLTKDYFIRCSAGVADSVNQISIDRTVDLLLTNTLSAPSLVCSTNQHCIMNFDKGNVALFDFVLPSFPVTLDAVLLTWQTVEATVVVSWGLNWCAYAKGQGMCDAISAPNKVVMGTPTENGNDDRRDTLIPGTVWPTAGWVPDVHVVVAVSREFLGDTSSFTPSLQNIRLEFRKG